MNRYFIACTMCSALLSACASTDSDNMESTNQNSPPPAETGQAAGPVDDAAIERSIGVGLADAGGLLSDAHINVHSFNGVVLLTGQVPSPEAREEATRLVAFAAADVRRIVNELEVAEQMNSSSEAADAELARSLNQQIQSDLAIDADQMRVVVENGTVYLMGTLPRDQAQAAATLASTQRGVESVRTLFEYTD